MVNPIAVAAVGSKLLGSFFGGKAKKKHAKYVKAQQDAHTKFSGESFDTRMDWQNAGDLVQYQIEGEAAETADRLDREGTSQILDAQGRGFDETQAIGRRTLAESLGVRANYRDEAGAIASGRRSADAATSDRLFNTLRDVRTGNLALSKAERDRQHAFQAEADSVASAFLAKEGTDAFDASRTASEAKRFDTLTSTVTGPTRDVPLTASGHGLIKSMYAQRSGEGVQRGVDGAVLDNRLAAYGDATYDARRAVSDAGRDLSIIDMKAGLSGGAVTPELAVGGIRATNAGTTADAAMRINNDDADARARALEGFSASNADAITQHGRDLTSSTNQHTTAFAQAVANLFGGRMDAADTAFTRRGAAEASYTGDKVGANMGQENSLRETMETRVSGSRPGNAGKLFNTLGDIGITLASGGFKFGGAAAPAGGSPNVH